MKIQRVKSTHNFRASLTSSNLLSTLLDFSTILSDYAAYASYGSLKYVVALESLDVTINLFTFPLAQLPNIDFTTTDTEKAALVAAVEQQYPGVSLRLTDNNGLSLAEMKCQNYNGIEYFQPMLVPGLAFREFKALDVNHSLILSCIDIGNGNLQTGDYVYAEGTLSLYVSLVRPNNYGLGEYGNFTFTTPSIIPGQTLVVNEAIAATAFVDRVTVSAPCRVRCYRDNASAVTDLVRPLPTQFQQTNISGLCFDLNFGAGMDASGNQVNILDIYCKPNTVMRAGRTANYFSITNTGSTATPITLTIYFEALT